MNATQISTDLTESSFRRLRRGQKTVDVGDLPEQLQRKVRAQVSGGTVDSLLSRQFNPFIQRMSLEEPRSWEERVRWKRYFYQTDPLINAAINVHCLPAGEPVITKEGVKSIENVTIDDTTLSSKGGWQPVLGTDSHDFDGEMYAIAIRGIPLFHCTDEHPILVRESHTVKTSRKGRDGKIHWDSERKEPNLDKDPVWKKASDLKVGDYVLIPKLQQAPTCAVEFIVDLAPYAEMAKQTGGHYKVGADYLMSGTGKMRRFVPLSVELATVLGWYVAEGSAGSHFTLHADETKEAAAISDALQKIFGRGTSGFIQVDKRNGNTAQQLNFGFAPFNRWTKSACGDGSHNKKVPDFILQSKDIAIIKAFLTAYYDGDGCYRTWDRHAITASRTLAYQIQLLLGKLGIFAKIKRYPHTKTRTMQYVIIVSKREWVTKFLGQEDPHKKKHYGLVFQDDEYFYSPIHKIKHSRVKCRVYDIHTQDNSFAVPFLVHNSQFPLSNLHIQHEDEGIREFFEDMLDEMDFYEFLVDFNTEFNITGEVIPYGFFDDSNKPGTWKGFILINPVNATIEGSEFVQGPHKDTIILRLDPKLRRIVDNPNDPVLGELCKKLSPDIVQAIRTGQGLRLNPLQASRLRRPGSYFSRRSASMIDSVFRDLMYREKLRSAQYSIADRHITPREFYFIGSDANIADQAELDNFREALANSWTDVNSAIVYHHDVRVQIEGTSGKILPIWPEMEATDKRIMVGMEINEAMIMGDASSFATSVVGYDVVISRWLAQRQRIEKWIRRAVLGPIAKIHKMYVPENKIKSSKYRREAGLPRPLWIPDVRWEKQHLRDESARLDLLTKLAAAKQVPMELLYDLLELDAKSVDEMVDKEIEAQAVRKKKLAERLKKMGVLEYADFGQQKDDGSGGGGGMGMPAGDMGGGAMPSAGLGGADDGGAPGGNMPSVMGADMEAPSADLAGGLPGGPGAVVGASPAAGGTNPQPGAASAL